MIDHSPKHKILSNFVTPLTPQTNKKVFIETLLMPTPSTIDRVFDEEKAIELFAANHNDIQISVCYIISNITLLSVNMIVGCFI